jgi:hypothetical protein
VWSLHTWQIVKNWRRADDSVEVDELLTWVEVPPPGNTKGATG